VAVAVVEKVWLHVTTLGATVALVVDLRAAKAGRQGESSIFAE